MALPDNERGDVTLNVEIRLLNVFQSVLFKYPLEVAPAEEIAMTPVDVL